MKYQPVVNLLAGFWDKSFEQLPPEQASAWREATVPGLAWDDLAPEQRQSVAAQHDQLHDPANAEENGFWFKHACDVADAEREIREIESMAATIPSEREAKKRLLDDARSRLDDLKSAQFMSSTAGNGSRLAACPYACTSQEIIDGFDLVGKNWSDILAHQNSDGKFFKEALVLPGKRGRGKGGVSTSALWNPVIFARLLLDCRRAFKFDHLCALNFDQG